MTTAAGALAGVATTPRSQDVAAEDSALQPLQPPQPQRRSQRYPPAPPGGGIAVKYEMIQIDGDIRARFDLLAALGFDGVEVPGPSNLDPDELLAASQATGVTIHGVVDSIHWNQPLSHPDATVRQAGLDGLRQALRDAHRLGASTVLLVAGVVNEQISYADAYRRSQAEIRKAIPLAEELGITIALENVWNNFLLSPLEAARYVDELESDRVGWYFDVGNVVRYGWPVHWIEALGRRIVKVDVKEYSRKKQMDEGPWKGFDVELRDGDCDWPAVMTALEKIGFDGWMTAEVRGGDEDRLRFLAERMNQIRALQ